MQSTMADSPAPRRFRLLKKRVSAMPMPRAPLKSSRAYSSTVKRFLTGSPNRNMVGTRRTMASRFLKKFNATG